MKPKVAIVRGKFLNRYEMQFFEPLVHKFDITAFGSTAPFHDNFAFPVVKLPSPMDLPEFPYKMPVLNRLFIDAQYLYGLEENLKGFDLVHTAETYYRYTQQALNAKRKGYVKKVIATVLENIPHNNEGIWGRKSFKKRARQELDHIIALTQKTKEVLVGEGADDQKITVISHFVDTKRFAPTPTTVKRRAKDIQSLTILFVGRLEEYKGVLDFLEAGKLLLYDDALREKKLTFLFVGEGSQKREMHEMIGRWHMEGNVEFMSVPYEQMPQVYERADIFVAPSRPTPTWQEQYCTSLLEAQAAGLPIVTTSSGGIIENIADAGLVITPGNVSQLASALKGFIVHAKARKEYAARARTRAVHVHDIAVGAKKMAALYRRVLSD